MDREEFSELMISHLDGVNAYARRLTDGGWDADDLVQATFERAFSRWRGLRHPDRSRAWLFSIAHRLFLDRVRARRSRPELRLVEPGDPVAPEPRMSAASIERDSLERALATLPDAQREAVLLTDLWGFSYDEVAEIMEAPVGTVRSRIARGRRALIAELAPSNARAARKGGRS